MDRGLTFEDICDDNRDRMRGLAEQMMMDVVLLDSAITFVGLLYVAVRAIRHRRPNSN
jgi:hypothetical protein